jgi:hypothetical protein
MSIPVGLDVIFPPNIRQICHRIWWSSSSILGRAGGIFTAVHIHSRSLSTAPSRKIELSEDLPLLDWTLKEVRSHSEWSFPEFWGRCDVLMFIYKGAAFKAFCNISPICMVFFGSFRWLLYGTFTLLLDYDRWLFHPSLFVLQNNSRVSYWTDCTADAALFSNIQTKCRPALLNREQPCLHLSHLYILMFTR